MKQPRLSLLEDATYSSWSINTLKRLARAFDLALSVKFEAFSDVILDFEGLSREALQRPSFCNDALFQSSKVRTFRRLKRERRGGVTDAERAALGQTHLFSGQVVQWPAKDPATQTRFSGAANGFMDDQKTSVFLAQGDEKKHAVSISVAG
jgi:hypothetical protein